MHDYLNTLRKIFFTIQTGPTSPPQPDFDGPSPPPSLFIPIHFGYIIFILISIYCAIRIFYKKRSKKF